MESNLLPPAYKAGAHPHELRGHGALGRSRTCCLSLRRAALCPVSYGRRKLTMVRGEGLEPPTHGISARRSAAELPARSDCRRGGRWASIPRVPRSQRGASPLGHGHRGRRSVVGESGAATGTRTPDLQIEGLVAWPTRLPRHDGCGGRSCTERWVAYETSRLLSAAVSMTIMVGPAGLEPASPR